MSQASIAKTPKPPYYAVVFTSRLSEEGENIGYEAMGDRMVEMASRQEGFLGVESVRDEAGLGITVSYWASLEAIRAWKDNAGHKAAQDKGKAEWYGGFALRVCKVERDQYFGL